jgi:hypothetical protein
MNLYDGTLLHIHITGFTNGTILFVSVGSGWYCLRLPLEMF